MAKLTFLTILILHCFGATAQNSFYYNIHTPLLQNEQVTKLYISYEIGGIQYTDSLHLKDGLFPKRMTLSQPVEAVISTDSDLVEPLYIILANNDINISITNNTLSIDKSKILDDYLYLTENDLIRPSYFPLYGELSEKNDTIGLKKLGVIFDSLANDDIQKSYAYFQSNKTSLLSLFSLNRYLTFSADYSNAEQDFALLPEWAQNSPDGKNIMAIMERIKAAQVNTQAKDFSQLSMMGDSISLKNFSGKYILLDFWASWCAPCRKKHPNLINTYNRYKNKNFDILSISLDSDKSNWENAIAKDKLIWTQVSDLKGYQNEVAVLYGVQSIPANFLIDPKGFIVAKNLSIDQLDETLKSLLNE